MEDEMGGCGKRENDNVIFKTQGGVAGADSIEIGGRNDDGSGRYKYIKFWVNDLRYDCDEFEHRLGTMAIDYSRAKVIYKDDRKDLLGNEIG